MSKLTTGHTTGRRSLRRVAIAAAGAGLLAALSLSAVGSAHADWNGDGYGGDSGQREDSGQRYEDVEGN